MMLLKLLLERLTTLLIAIVFIANGKVKAAILYNLLFLAIKIQINKNIINAKQKIIKKQ